MMVVQKQENLILNLNRYCERGENICIKKSVKILIVILCLTIVGLVTFIVIDKVIKLKVNLYDEDKILSKVNKNDTNTTKQKFNSEPEKMSTEDALNLGEKMYKEATNCYEKMSDIHSNLSTQNIGTTEKMEKIEDRTTMENIKKVLVNDAYNDLLEYFHAEEKDGEYYVNTGGMGSNPLYKETKALTVKNIESDKIVYTATSVYEVVRNSSATNETETKDYEFVLTKINGEWKVTEFTIPY